MSRIEKSYLVKENSILILGGINQPMTHYNVQSKDLIF